PRRSSHRCGPLPTGVRSGEDVEPPPPRLGDRLGTGQLVRAPLPPLLLRLLAGTPPVGREVVEERHRRRVGARAHRVTALDGELPALRIHDQPAPLCDHAHLVGAVLVDHQTADHRVTADSSTPRLAYLIALTSRLRSVSALAAELPLPRVGRVTTPLPLYRLCLLIVDPSQESELLRVSVCHTHPLTNRS